MVHLAKYFLAVSQDLLAIFIFLLIQPIWAPYKLVKIVSIKN